MIQFSQILTANGSAFFILILIKLIMHRQVKIKTLPDASILSSMINIALFQCFLDTLVFWIDGKQFPMARELNCIGNTVYYIFNVMIAYLWPLFTEYKLNCSAVKLKKLATVLGVPLAVIVIFTASNPFTGFFFTITEDNLYTRTGNNFLFSTGLIIIYLLFGTIRISFYHKSNGKYMIFPALYFVIPSVLAIIIQSAYYSISLSVIGTAIGIIGVFLSTQCESAYIDQLCGVYNRRYSSDYIRDFCNSKNKGTSVTGVLIDMDDFKSINDNFGHDVGDEALKQFSSVLRRHTKAIGFVVRYGGDEFILLTNKSEEAAKAVVNSIVDELNTINASGKNKFKLEFSYGIATIDSDSSSDIFLNMMDSRMYEMKRARKANR